MNIQELKEINKKKLEKMRIDAKKNPSNEQLKFRLNINEKIAEIFEKDEGIFFKIKIEDAYKILSNIIEKAEDIKKTYIDLTSEKEFKRLKKANKI